MSISIQQFINTYNGKYVQWRECVALFWQFNQDVNKGEAYSAPGAANLWMQGGQPYIWDTYDRVSLGQFGDWAIWSGTYGAYTNAGSGHVAMFVSDNGNGTGKFFSMNPNPAQIMTLSYNGIMGFLRPKLDNVAPQGGDITPITQLAGNQRQVGPNGSANYRKSPDPDSDLLGSFDPNSTLTFSAWTKGTPVSGIDIWFKGAMTGGYVWAGGLTDQGTHDLPQENAPAPAPAPAPALAGNQRQVGPDAAANYRKSPTSQSDLLGAFDPNSIINVSAWTHGENVSGIDVWFKGALTGGYVWAGAVTDQGTHDLAQEGSTPAPTPAPAPTPTPTPAPTPTPVPAAYDFVADFDFVEKIPANINNLQRASDYPGTVVFPSAPKDVVIHQFGTPGIDTVTSTINQFKNPNLGEKAVSAHFVVSGKRIIQMVSLKDRAYHAYIVGNNYVGIETDPAQDADTIASVNKLLRALKAKYGYTLTPIRHKDVPQCVTNCGALINLDNYQIDVQPAPAPTPDPTPVPVPTPAPTPSPAPDKEQIIAAYQAWQLQEYLRNS